MLITAVCLRQGEMGTGTEWDGDRVTHWLKVASVGSHEVCTLLPDLLVVVLRVVQLNT